MAGEKKEEKKRHPEAFGIAGFTLGIVSLFNLLLIVFSGPLMGIFSSIVGFFLCFRQQKRQKTKAGKVGIILNVIGFVLNITVMIVSALVLIPYLQQQLGTIP